MKPAMPAEEKLGYCTLCRSRCGTINVIRDDHLIAVRPDPGHPNGSALCMKGKAAPELVDSPHRQLYPMKRTRPKGDPNPGWQRISWEEALDTVASRLGQIKGESGAEAVAFSVTTPSGTPLSDSIEWVERFVRCFGSPNIAYATEICNWHKDVAHAFTFGCAMPVADYAQADTIMLWGHNPANTWLAQAATIAQGRARGARLLVIDPRPTALAREADVWLRVRPGTDAALALGLMRRLIYTERFDRYFVTAWTNAPYLVRSDTGRLLREQDVQPHTSSNRLLAWNAELQCAVAIDPDAAIPEDILPCLLLDGAPTVAVAGSSQVLHCETVFSLLRQHVEAFTAERIKQICDVDEEALIAAADLLGSGRRVAYHAWTGIGQHTNATQTERAVATLYALNGSFDRAGGNRVRKGPPVNALAPLSLLPAEQRVKALGYQSRPLGPPASGWVTARDLYRAVIAQDPYPVRALMSFGTNVLLSHADTDMAMQALQRLEFHVHLDLFETPAARYADIFLPVNTPWEREGLRVGFESTALAAGFVQLRPRMVTPRGESRSDSEIILALAVRMGLRHQFFDGDLIAGWNHQLEHTGLDVEGLRRRGAGVQMPVDERERKYALPGSAQSTITGFSTPSRRVEIFSETLLAQGQPGFASYVQAAEDARLAQGAQFARFPLVLTSVKNGYYCHSQHRSLVSLRKRAPDPVVEISPDLANRRGIEEGDWVRVITRIGAARFVARLLPGLADDVVAAEFGWWQACYEFDRTETPVTGSGTSNYNALISAQDSDPVSGSVGMRSFRCDIEPDTLHQQHRKWQGFLPFRVTSIANEASGVVSVELECADRRTLPDFHPGQHLRLSLQIDGQAHARAYSLTGNCCVVNRTRYTIAVRRQEGVDASGERYEGLVSTFIHTRLHPGDVVGVEAPSGTFLVPRQSPQPIVLLAGGIGITPFISLLESLPDGDPSEIWLHFANRSASTHAFRERLLQHANRLPGLKLFSYYSEPEERHASAAAPARLTASVITDGLLARRPRFFLCGAPPMMTALEDALLARGVPRFDLFKEIFRSPAKPAANDGRSFTVRFLKSASQVFHWTAECGALLEFAQSQGIQLASGCRVGQCESCAVRVVSGAVRHLHGTEPEDAAVCLACQAVPTEDLVLDA